MIDFTKEIVLEKEWKKKYQYARIFVFLIFILTGFFVLYKILLPSASFEFFFATPNATKNTITNPRNEERVSYQNGLIGENGKIIFDTGVAGNFSNSKVFLNLKKDYFQKIDGTIKVRKSYQAFFYPEGDPLPFKNGTLLKNKSEYYIVSQNRLRKFFSEDVAFSLGFKKEAFLEVSTSELMLNQQGYDIENKNDYPEDSIFKIEDEYYQVKDKQMFPFVSEKAFLTRFDPIQAIEKDSLFLDKYEISEDYIGFNDGTLLSFDDSVYVVSGKNSYPIYDPSTFESMGYLWNEVIPAGSEEIGMYEKQKVFTIKNPHPDGAIFKTQENGKFYYIKDQQKKEVTSLNVLKTYLRNSPIDVQEKSLETFTSCKIEPSLRILGRYSCDIDITSISTLNGNDYQFEIEMKNPLELKTIETKFHQILSASNMRFSVSVIKKRILENYSTK